MNTENFRRIFEKHSIDLALVDPILEELTSKCEICHKISFGLKMCDNCKICVENSKPIREKYFSKFKVGDYIVAEKSWPEMGNACGIGYDIRKITRITPTGKIRAKELPTSRTNSEYNMNSMCSSWKMHVTNFDPIEEKGILIDPDGEYTNASDRVGRTYKKITREELQEKVFDCVHDGYN